MTRSIRMAGIEAEAGQLHARLEDCVKQAMVAAPWAEYFAAICSPLAMTDNKFEIEVRPYGLMPGYGLQQQLQLDYEGANITWWSRYSVPQPETAAPEAAVADQST